jgi:hypothetical protein
MRTLTNKHRFLSVCICVHPWLICFSRAEVLDRIAVTVDKQVITLGDVVRELRVDAFLDRRPVDLGTDAKRKAAARLVDQVLILREAADSHLVLATPNDAARLLLQVKSQYPADPEYRAALADYHITEADLSEHLLNGLRALRFTDSRFRPQIQVTEAELRQYYDNLTADWGKPAAGFEQNRGQVEKLLTDERVMRALDAWLEMERVSKQVRYREAAFK